MGRYIKLRSEDALSDIQGFDLPMMGDTLLPTKNHIPTIKEKLADIDVGITRFEDMRGRNAGLGPELSHITIPYQLDELGSQGRIPNLDSIPLSELVGLVLNKKGRARVVRNWSKQQGSASEVDSGGLSKEANMTVLAKRIQQEFDEEFDDTVGRKKRRGADEKVLTVKARIQPRRY